MNHLKVRSIECRNTSGVLEHISRRTCAHFCRQALLESNLPPGGSRQKPRYQWGGQARPPTAGWRPHGPGQQEASLSACLYGNLLTGLRGPKHRMVLTDRAEMANRASETSLCAR